MAHRLQYRRDIKENWLKYNPVLMEGEVGYETDTHHQKVGDGVSTYSELEYVVGVGNITQEMGDSESLVMSQKAVSKKLGGVEDSKFVFDFTESASKTYLDVNGQEIDFSHSSSVFDTTYFIGISLWKYLNGSIKYKGEEFYKGICFYDCNRNYIPISLESEIVEEISMVEVPKNARFFRLCATKSENPNIVLTAIKIKDLAFMSDLTDKWKDKDVLLFGDSFFDYGRLPNALKMALGVNIINRGVDGSTIISRKNDTIDTPKPNQSLLDRLRGEDGALTESGNGSALPENCDLIIINAGINDYAQGRSVGTIDLGISDDEKVYSAAQSLIIELRQKYPLVPMIWCIPCHVGGDNIADYSYAEDGTLNFKSVGVGKTKLADVVKAIKDVCSLLSVPIVDYYSESNYCPNDANMYNSYTSNGRYGSVGTPDGLHPSDSGSKVLVNYLLWKIDSLFSC